MANRKYICHQKFNILFNTVNDLLRFLSKLQKIYYWLALRPRLSVLLVPAVWDLSVVVVVDSALLGFVVGALSHLQLTAGGVDGLETAGLALVSVQESSWPLDV